MHTSVVVARCVLRARTAVLSVAQLRGNEQTHPLQAGRDHLHPFALHAVSQLMLHRQAALIVVSSAVLLDECIWRAALPVHLSVIRFVPSCTNGEHVPTLHPLFSVVVQVIAKNVRMGAADVGALAPADDAGGFGTDSAISRGRCSRSAARTA